ncbi:MAG: OmpA family protein [Chitinophagaceae bacterium]
MSSIQFSKQTILTAIVLITGLSAGAQEAARPQPKWWFGVSGAANFNKYRGTTQELNQDVSVPTAFHKGSGVRPYFSVLTEYRPNKVLGGSLNIAYDGRGGKFKEVMAPCDCPANLSTNISYIAIEPSLRIAPFSSGFYIFGGPTLSFNTSKSFVYKQDKQDDKKGDWSEVHSTVFSGQAGIGYDVPVSSKTNSTQVTLSPFASFLTDFGHDARSVESWSMYSYRAGVALKFGKSKKVIPLVAPESEPVLNEAGFRFSVTPPDDAVALRQVKEMFPLRNSVYFDEGSVSIPSRYTSLSPAQAKSFRELTLQDGQPDDLSKGRSARQMAVYHNILNIMGDRMRLNPRSEVALTGISQMSAGEGGSMAQAVKQYLVSAFGIDPSRISVQGNQQSADIATSTVAGDDPALIQSTWRRVDITSKSPELLLQVGGASSPWLQPVNLNSVDDAKVVFNAPGADTSVLSWKLLVTDDKGAVRNFGPYTGNQVSIPTSAILGARTSGDYKVTMTANMKNGQVVEKMTGLALKQPTKPVSQDFRYSILFNFDESTTTPYYRKFLTEHVTPLITDNATVIIRGHTDKIGQPLYNQKLSEERAAETKNIIEAALAQKGIKGVTFRSAGFGQETESALFKNQSPEELVYNRTVTVDILPAVR